MKVILKSKEKKANVTSKTKKKKLKKEKVNIYLKMVGRTNYTMFKEMNNSDLGIIQWQKRRFLSSLLFPVFGTALYFSMGNKWIFLLGGLVIAVFYYYNQSKSVRGIYSQFRFERHLQFSKFTRLLIPYLNDSKEGVNLYTIFGKVVKRLDYETDKNLLMRLMNNMIDQPNDIQPFMDYAEQTSGSDMSILFMCTLFDIRQGASDLNVISELDKLASEELMTGIDSIINFKLNRFAYFPTKMTMTTFLLVIGFMIGIGILQVKTFFF